MNKFIIEENKYGLNILNKKNKDIVIYNLRFDYYLLSKNELIDLIYNYNWDDILLWNYLREESDKVVKEKCLFFNEDLLQTINGITWIAKRIAFIWWLNVVLQRFNYPRLVIIGWSAIECYKTKINTLFDTYIETHDDIDCVFWDKSIILEILKPYGFIKEWRFIWNKELWLYLECPTDKIDNIYPYYEFFIDEVFMNVPIININDLILDRYIQYKAWNKECLTEVKELLKETKFWIDDNFLIKNGII